MAGFTIPLTQLAEKWKADLDTVTRKATLEVYTKVKNMTPVDTGRFRANWNVSHNVIDASTTESTDQSRMDREIAKVLTYPAGGVVYLCNGLPYATALEYGHSKLQAPNGMVRVSAQEFSDYVQEAIRK
jgi:hypothetical protein